MVYGIMETHQVWWLWWKIPSVNKENAALTHWGLDKMATVFVDDIFICIFFNENFWI